MRSPGALALAAAVLIACAPSIQAHRVAEIAQQFVIAGQPSGSVMHDLAVA
jgi:hypothetical protein